MGKTVEPETRQLLRLSMIIGVLGCGLACAFIFSVSPYRVIEHFARLYEDGMAKIRNVNWVDNPAETFSLPSFLVREEPIPVAAIDPPPLSTESRWSWPFKTTPSDPPAKKIAPPGPYGNRIRYPIPQRITLSHIEGNNFTNCFATNYTKAQLMLSGEYVPGTILPQIDFRGDRFDDTTYSTSAGVVVRYIPKKEDGICRMLGLNLYYDFRSGNVGYFNQIGTGIEILSKRWDFRANAYVPFGAKRKLQRCVFDDFIGDFFAIKDIFESVSYGFNVEVGWLAINSQYLLLYLAGGPYYVAGRKCFDKTRGGEFRIQPQYKDFLALNAIFSYDPLFNAVYQFELIVHLPLYMLSKKIDKKETCGLTPRQIYQPVIRYDVMPIARCCCWQFNWDGLIP